MLGLRNIPGEKNMPLDIVLGAQWGDEGKGSITDLLAENADMVVRFSGGDNAGHTIRVGDETFKLHLIPSGIIHDGTMCLIGNGVVLNPAVFLRELKGLEERGINISPDRLKISRNTHLITPAHIALDTAKEAARGDGKIGTTLRGIGPAYLDKIGRAGIRANLLEDPETLSDAIQAHVAGHNETLTKIYGAEALDATAIAAEFHEHARQIAPYLADGSVMVDAALKEGKTVLAEGAQGTMLDVDHGTYPFVTSSSPTTGGVITGLGVGPGHIGKILGVAKAFSSRVGSGPFAAELFGDEALRLRGTGANPWDEYGTTTGRPRRVGWLDLVVLEHAVRINGLTEITLTKLDILSGLKEVPVCVAYEMDGKRVQHLPLDLPSLEKCTPIYETLPGWSEDIMQVTKPADLPANAIAYVKYVENYLGVRINRASVGPERDQNVDF